MPRILIVDDAEVDRRVIRSVLQQERGTEVGFAENGAKALEELERADWDLVVTDLVMPVMNGLQLVREVRNKYPWLPVIIVTSKGSEVAAVEALRSGAANYVPKSLVAARLRETIRHLLAISSVNRVHERLMDCVTENRLKLEVPNDPTLIDSLVIHLVNTMTQMKVGSPSERRCIGVAVKEALTNALYHGNLQVEAKLRPQVSYEMQAELRRNQPPYRDRRIYVEAALSQDQSSFVIRDEGQGFNARSLPDPGDPRAIERPSGRGLVLIRNFMDEVSFNEAGNCVTMSKRHRAVKIPKPILFNTPEADQILGQTDLLSPGSPWRECITERPVHPSSDKIIASIGSDRGMGANLDMGFAIIPPTQKPVEIRLMDAALAAQSDKGALPIPDNAPIEGWPLWPPGVPLEELQRQGRGSRRVIVVDPARKMLYELAGARRVDTGWEASQASVWNLGSGESRPTGWISADGAGLPIFPGVVRYDEVQRGMVEHAIRVTVKKTRREAVHPASHADSMYTSGQLPRMGERFRLRASFDISGFSPHVQAILKGLKHYGMIVADHGYDWHISVAPDARIEGLEELGRVTGSDFEAIVPSPAPEGRRPEAQLAQPMQARVRTVAAPQAGRSVSAERAAE